MTDSDQEFVCVDFLPEWENPLYIGHALQIIFNIRIEQGRSNRRNLVNSIPQVEAFKLQFLV
jgi:hypothetical protein